MWRPEYKRVALCSSMEVRMNIVKFLKEWMLPIGMVTGASMYLIYYMLPEQIHVAGPFLSKLVGILQPVLIFSMLFLTFCRIEPRDLKPHRWHWWLLLIQGGLFTILGMVAIWVMKSAPYDFHDKLVLIESAMLCLICPTATAAAVVTRKLGGDVAGITTYTVLINIVTALIVPLIVPLIHPMAGFGFWQAFSLIVAKIFPLLIMPCLAAWLVRYLAPALHKRLLVYPDLAFYLWAVALTLAIVVTTKSIVHSTMSVGVLLTIAAISLVCCIFQFAVGRFVGSCYRPVRRSRPPRQSCQSRFRAGGGTVLDAQALEAQQRGRRMRTVTAGQSLGQKNTVFAIWMGYTFMTPETAIVGGLYCIWHNLYNAWQLHRAGKE